MGKLLGKKPDVGAARAVVAVLPSEGVLARLPGVWEYLTQDKWEGGGKRQPSTLSVFVDDGSVKASLNDRALSRSCFATGASLEACLLALEAMLQDESADWRGWKPRK